ncbi:MAG: ATP-binding protein [Acidobacteria bacterium]|nr:ATP-binding protein [Acidobacteriota bacterium]
MGTHGRPSCEFDADKLIVRFDFTIRAHVREITPLVERVVEMVKGFGCARGKEFEVELSLHEALVNAVVHGSRSDPGKDVQVSVACDESRGILIVVRDSGPGFSPDQIPSPILAQNIFSTHGRGIYLINQLMDEVSYERGGTEIRMRKGAVKSE